MLPTEPTMPTTVVSILVIAVTALATVVAFLFKYYSGRQAAAELLYRVREEEITKERITWARELKAIRTEFEMKHRAMLEGQVKIMADLHEEAREHENMARREFAENMELVASKASEASEKIAAVLDKFYDRFVGPRRR